MRCRRYCKEAVSCFTSEQVKRVSAHCAVVCHRNGRVHRSPPAVGIRYRTGPPCFFFPLLDVRLESRLRDAVRSRRTFSKISFANAGAACATDRDKTNAPSISQSKLIARSRNVLPCGTPLGLCDIAWSPRTDPQPPATWRRSRGGGPGTCEHPNQIPNPIKR